MGRWLLACADRKRLRAVCERHLLSGPIAASLLGRIDKRFGLLSSSRPPQAESTPVYRMFYGYEKEQVWEGLKARLQLSRVDRVVWRSRPPSDWLKKAPTFSSRAAGRRRSMRP